MSASACVREEQMIVIPHAGGPLRERFGDPSRADGRTEPELLLVDRAFHFGGEDSHRRPTSVSASAHATAASLARRAPTRAGPALPRLNGHRREDRGAGRGRPAPGPASRSAVTPTIKVCSSPAEDRNLAGWPIAPSRWNPGAHHWPRRCGSVTLAVMTVERAEPPLAAGEREMLQAWLEFHRDTLAIKCEGLTGDQLRERAVPPSSLSLLGLVRHMAEGEHQWFTLVLGGEQEEQAPYPYYTEDNPDADFDDVDAADVAEAFQTWRSGGAAARERIAAAPSLDATGIQDGREFSLRWIMIHMIEEYARHCGHADLLRERIDGAVGA